jgi:hypothetical protein
MDIDRLEARLNAWIRAEDEAQRYFAARLAVARDSVDVQTAAMTVLGVEDVFGLLDREWTAGELIPLLADVDFKAWNSFEELPFEHSILPSDVPRRLDEETIKHHGEKWRIHAYDPDPFPSLPHAHNLFEGIKMDLRNGRLYRKRELIGTMHKKGLLEFPNRVQRIELPPLDEPLAV